MKWVGLLLKVMLCLNLRVWRTSLELGFGEKIVFMEQINLIFLFKYDVWHGGFFSLVVNMSYGSFSVPNVINAPTTSQRPPAVPTPKVSVYDALAISNGYSSNRSA